MTVIEASKASGLGATTIRKLIKDGKLPARRVEQVGTFSGFRYELDFSIKDLLAQVNDVRRRGKKSRAGISRSANSCTERLYSVAEVAGEIRAATGAAFTDQTVYNHINSNRIALQRYGSRIFLSGTNKDKIIQHYVHDMGRGNRQAGSDYRHDVMALLKRIAEALERIERLWE